MASPMLILELALLGLGAGTAYVLMGLGIALIFRGSGVLNFAQGGIAMLSAEVFYGLRDDRGWPTSVALLVALGTAMSVGLFMHFVVLRYMKNASALARLISTLGMLAILQGIAQVAWGSATGAGASLVTGLFPSTFLHFNATLGIGEDRLILVGICVFATTLCWFVYQRTRYGIATSALAENGQAAVLLGWSPNTIGAANWVVGSLLAGLAGIFISPISTLSTTTLVLTVIPGLAAALLGGFSSFWLIFAGGLGIGVVQSEMANYVPTGGWSDSVPFLLIVVVVIVRGRGLPQRGELLDRPARVGSGRIRPSIVIPAVTIVGLVIAAVPAPWLLALSTAIPMALIALSVVVITGYAGQISLAQLSIAGVGALSAADAAHFWGAPFPAAVVFGALTAAAVGLVIGLPALRVRGMSLAVVTIGLGLVIQEVVLSNPTLTGGELQIVTTPTPRLIGFNVDFTAHPVRYTMLMYAVFVLCALAAANLRRGRTGRRLLALRNNERAALSSGVHVYGTKLFAFTLASGIAGLGGALAAFQFRDLNLLPYTALSSIQLLLTSIVGGVGFVGGAIVSGVASPGSVATQALSYFPGSWASYLGLIIGIAVLAVLLLAPSGVSDIYVRQFAWLRGLRTRRGSATGPAELIVDAGSHLRTQGRQLRVRGLSVRFGGVRALHDVDLDVVPGEVLGVVGPNGAGKTTLIDAVCGLVRSAGSVTIDGKSIDRLSARERVHRGLGRTFQGVELFDDMSVLDNIRIAAEGRGTACYLTDLVWPRDIALPDVARAAIKDLRLHEALPCDPEQLPTGTRRMVGLARTLAGRPSVVLLDEPAAGLNDEEKRELATLIRHLATVWGLAVLLIEHDTRFVTSVSDRMIALSLGRVIAEGRPTEVMADKQVVKAYLGSAGDGERPGATRHAVATLSSSAEAPTDPGN